MPHSSRQRWVGHGSNTLSHRPGGTILRSRVLRETASLMRAAPTFRLPTLYAAMIEHIAQGRLPPRENRIDPRVVKKKMSNLGKKRPRHYPPPQSQRPFEQSVVMIK